MQGYLRPQTSQSNFVNFKKLLVVTKWAHALAFTQICLGLRNEFSPGEDLLRVREFTMGEFEHFVDYKDKTHPKFKSIAHFRLTLYHKNGQKKKAPLTSMSIGEAVPM